LRRFLAISALALGLPGAASAKDKPPAEWTGALVAGDWALAAQTADTVVFAKAPEPRLGPLGRRRIQVRFEFATPHVGDSQKPYLSLLVLTEYDCAQNKTRNVQATAFGGHNLTSPLGEPAESLSDWSNVEDSAIASILQKDACGD
jgi:hypothetical protein